MKKGVSMPSSRLCPGNEKLMGIELKFKNGFNAFEQALSWKPVKRDTNEFKLTFQCLRAGFVLETLSVWECPVFKGSQAYFCRYFPEFSDKKAVLGVLTSS